MGEENGTSLMEATPPWSLFSEREPNCPTRIYSLPLSGISSNHQNLIPQDSLSPVYKPGFSSPFVDFDPGYAGSRPEKDQSGQEGYGFGGNRPENDFSSSFSDAMAALQRYLPSNYEDQEPNAAIDAYSCDEFRMYDFKVRRCVRGRSHDWTECPYAHPGEKARRRDPRKFHYSGTACPDFRKGNCKRGDSCEFAHGVFECWLHPARYRTQPCKDGTSCRRRVCFFAHTPEQLRVLPQNPSPRYSGAVSGGFPGVSRFSGESYDGSPMRLFAKASSLSNSLSSPLSNSLSPTSTLASHVHSPPALSPPLSPSVSPPLSPANFSPENQIFRRRIPVSDVVSSLKNLQLGGSPNSGAFMAVSGNQGRFSGGFSSSFRPAFSSLPSTPTKVGWTDSFGNGVADEEEPVERVESGRDLRAQLFAKLSRQNSMAERTEAQAPDLGWVSELVK
ncbi:zinc finger CCCH domain-containing protein 20 [Amborella trichopoda]|uniref:C3H1-type domain-containing protein n=1 Tax=Amborella trichopoda TaxID=13333 RepID=U5D1G8_AMBTC|nr:zinc finger CCCH domain-containing protein 20 [Amborella trichopoda]ERN15247.1 hypothetical protein AMTR_s00056p00207550 [Amborella trichopoda]|eukprot:XP_006853780.1 zinc finger CCCH domain-containing protein 20 [Amborella trichopoda]